LFVWYGEISENWEHSLPKRLSVRFKDANEKLVLLCIEAHLSDVADIRQLGQQIGMQANENKQLAFCAPLIEYEPPEILRSDTLGYYLHYQVTFILTEIPNALSLPQRKYKQWKYPFKPENLTIENI
jgi:hypothetical protein